METIGERLKKLRKNMNLPQRELADFLNISQILYSKYESNERNLKVTQLTKLSYLYDVTEEYILYGEGEIQIHPHFPHTKGMDLKTLMRMNKIIRNLEEMVELCYDEDYPKS